MHRSVAARGYVRAVQKSGYRVSIHFSQGCVIKSLSACTQVPHGVRNSMAETTLFFVAIRNWRAMLNVKKKASPTRRIKPEGYSVLIPDRNPLSHRFTLSLVITLIRWGMRLKDWPDGVRSAELEHSRWSTLVGGAWMSLISVICQLSCYLDSRK